MLVTRNSPSWKLSWANPFISAMSGFSGSETAWEASSTGGGWSQRESPNWNGSASCGTGAMSRLLGSKVLVSRLLVSMSVSNSRGGASSAMTGSGWTGREKSVGAVTSTGWSTFCAPVTAISSILWRTLLDWNGFGAKVSLKGECKSGAGPASSGRPIQDRLSKSILLPRSFNDCDCD